MNGVEEICRLAEEAYDKGLVKPAPHNLFSNGCACALGAAAVSRIVARGVELDDGMVFRVTAELEKIASEFNVNTVAFGYGFDAGIQNDDREKWGESSTQYEAGYKFGDKIRQKFLFPEVPSVK